MSDQIMRPVSGLWASARTCLLDESSPPEAHRAGRRFFFAGVLCVLDLQEQLADLPPEQREQVQRAMREELRVFFATQGSVVEGLV